MIKINIDNNLYPKSLKSIPNPPSSLYLDGNVDLLNSYSIAIIGTRSCSENGKKLTAKFATELSTTGITIVSGLATGIDTIAHTNSYNNLGKTIAVLGCGFNNIFPEENINLYKKILENDGLIVSEYPPDEKAKSSYFLERNRIVSGLSLGILVIEAFYRSGTSVTANHAIKQGRQVFTIPHEIWDSRGVGTNRLLKQGAKLVTDTADILDILKLNRLKCRYLDLKSQGIFDEFSKNTFSFNNSKSDNTALKTEQYSISPSLSDPKQSKIYKCIKNTNTLSVNDISHETGYSVNEVLSILFVLEVDGYIKKVEGGYRCM